MLKLERLSSCGILLQHPFTSFIGLIINNCWKYLVEVEECDDVINECRLTCPYFMDFPFGILYECLYLWIYAILCGISLFYD